jgi:glycosyltransferase involved in cell wall biosynthesis
MKIVQINTAVNTGSTGRITEDIGKILISKGYDSYIAYGRGSRPSESKLVRIGSQLDVINHGLKTVILDRHGFGSTNATRAFIEEIDKIKPDAIGLHNLHGYYINIGVLFEYLQMVNIPVIWTLFDCWAFTGHCTYFDDINCTKWITRCYSCPKKRKYPSSYLIDNSRRNFLDKRNSFSKVKNLHIIVHSQWLKGLVEQSFLNIYPVHHIFSGIDLNVFKPVKDNLVKDRYNLHGKKIILGVASKWDTRKGLSDFVKLIPYLIKEWKIVLIGLSEKQINSLPPEIIGITRTESIDELATLYSSADVFVNPTWLDNFPTTNLEALACGTPVITYNTGGSPEAIDNETGFVIDVGDLPGLVKAIESVLNNGKQAYSTACRLRAQRLFDKNIRYNDYISLYTNLTS